jgi:hypothetical protein
MANQKGRRTTVGAPDGDENQPRDTMRCSASEQADWIERDQGKRPRRRKELTPDLVYMSRLRLKELGISVKLGRS